jgi:hypothetical protein
MKGVTFLTASARKFIRLPRAISTEYDLGPVELWLLIKLHGHQDGIFSPSLKEIDEAAKAEGACQSPNIKTLEKAYKSLQEKGYVQVRRVCSPSIGAVWVRSTTMEPGVFERDLLGLGAPSDDELAVEIVKFNDEQQRADFVRVAYERRARRERAAASNVVEIDEFRRRHAG